MSKSKNYDLCAKKSIRNIKSNKDDQKLKDISSVKNPLMRRRSGRGTKVICLEEDGNNFIDQGNGRSSPEIEIIKKEIEVFTGSNEIHNPTFHPFFSNIQESTRYISSNGLEDVHSSEDSISNLSQPEQEITVLRRSRNLDRGLETDETNPFFAVEIELVEEEQPEINVEQGLTNNEINRLFSRKYSNIITKTKKCGICMSKFKGFSTVTQLDCSHIFHATCVIQWLLNNNNCPMCRQKVVERDF